MLCGIDTKPTLGDRSLIREDRMEQAFQGTSHERSRDESPALRLDVAGDMPRCGALGSRRDLDMAVECDGWILGDGIEDAGDRNAVCRVPGCLPVQLDLGGHELAEH